MKGKLVASMLEAIKSDASFEDFANLLRAYKDHGMTQREAVEALTPLYKTLGEDEKDRFLDAMDVVEGWCSPEYRVWATG